MLNQVILVGRVADMFNEEMVIRVPDTNKKTEDDIIPVSIVGNIGKNVKEYCHEGDIIGIKGKLKAKGNSLIVAAEKVTFLSSKTTEEDSNNERG